MLSRRLGWEKEIKEYKKQLINELKDTKTAMLIAWSKLTVVRFAYNSLSNYYERNYENLCYNSYECWKAKEDIESRLYMLGMDDDIYFNEWRHLKDEYFTLLEFV